MKRTILILSAVLMVFMLCGCKGSQKATFDGSKTGDENHYDISFKMLNTTYTHKLEMKAGESILVHIEKESGDIKVMIQKEGETPVYEGNGDAATDFSVKVSEDGTYTVSVTGKEARGHVTFTKK